jgi:hypothetical protein
MIRLTSPPSPASRLEARRVRFEPLEDRKMLAATVYHNDNWVNVSDPGNPVEMFDVVVNSADTINTGGVVGVYGSDAFGTVDGTSLPGAKLIYDALVATDSGGQLNILEGTYTESDIVIDRPLSVVGANPDLATTLIIPEATSSKSSATNFGVGTRSGIILYSPNVTIENLTLDGNGNGSLGGSMHYHHGITTLYDTQNGGNYSSLRNGTLPPSNLGSAHSTTNFEIVGVTVKNAWWHGITLSGLSGQTIGQNSVVNATVIGIGPAGSQDLNRIGIQIQNNDNGEIVDSKVTNAGVGMASGIFGPGTFGQTNAARNESGMRGNTVTDAVQRAYSVAFQDGQIDLNFLILPGSQFVGFDNNRAVNTGANNAIGLYINHSQPVVAGFVATGPKIGVKVENTTTVDFLLPIFTASALTGPGSGVSGSVGILAENSVAEPNSVNFAIGGATTISGYEIGIKTNQAVAPLDSVPNIAQIDRVLISGNATGVQSGTGSIVQGNITIPDPVTTAGNGTISPGFPQSQFLVTSPSAFAPANSDVFSSGNVSLTSSSSFTPLLSGQSGTTQIFDFNHEVVYPLVFLPPAPINGQTNTPYGSSWVPDIVQDGTGQLVIGGNALNGPLALGFGSNNHEDPNNPGNFILDPVDISGRTKLDMVVKLGPGNESQGLLFGLVDISGNISLWAFPMTTLNSSTYTTLSLNLLSPGVPFSLADDGNFDLSKVIGYAILADNGLINGANTIPFRLTFDNVSASSVINSQLNVTGTVNLGGASLGASISPGFTPTVGQQFTLINNDGVDPVVGTFAAAPQGGTVSISGQNFTISYIGGTGNDVVLTKAVDVDTAVVGRRIFYNQSKFDGGTTSLNASDDLAIATDKSAYLPGSGAATFSNITSFTRGINGIMVDIDNPFGTLTAADFTFKMSTQVGANNTPSTWAAAPAPISFSVRAGAGTSGSDRVEIIWANGAIANRWLEVIVEGNDAAGGFNANTGLAESDIFFFGNRIGDTGTGTPTLAITSATDELAARNNPGAGATVTNLVDFDRSGIVNATDQIASRGNAGTLTKINITDPPAAPAGDGDSAVATALAIPGLPSIPGVPAWIARRLDSIDLDSGPVARFLEHLAAADTPGARKVLERIHDVAHDLGLEHELLDDLLEGLG